MNVDESTEWVIKNTIAWGNEELRLRRRNFQRRSFEAHGFTAMAHS
jgi:hypothetical protein